MKYPLSIQNLIYHFSKLPSVGPKTAERYVFYLLKQNAEELQKMAQAIAELKEKTTVCQTCLSLAENSPCVICSDTKRNQEIICIVTDTKDMLGIEATREYAGLYHILGGVINLIENIKPENLNLAQLNKRLEKNTVKELILALSPNLNGETTSMYLSKLYSNKNLKITRLARGLPNGSDLEYMDDLTIANALRYRSEI